MEHSRTLRDELIALLVLAGQPVDAIAEEVELSSARCRLIARGFFINADPPGATEAADRIAEIRRLREVAASPTLRALALREQH